MTPVLASLLLSTAAFAAAAATEVPAAAVTAPPEEPLPVSASPPEISPPQSAVPQDSTAPTTEQPTNAPVPAPIQRTEAYNRFRAMFDLGRFVEALPLAQQVVDLTEAQSTREYELSIAYNNLAATQYRLGDLQAAETSYKKSLAILEASQGISSTRMIIPLQGLGTVYAALDQHAAAAEHLNRALAISRRSEGLFNLSQLPLIDQLVNSLKVLGDYTGAEHERYYALRIAEQNYGFDDTRTLPAVTQLASFYESTSQFAAARGLYLRMYDISIKEHGGLNPLTVRSLVAIARTHRLQYTMDPASLDDQITLRDPNFGDQMPEVARSAGLPPHVNRSGLNAIEKAVGLLRSTPDPPPRLLLEALVEMGDWLIVTAKSNAAMASYSEAAAIQMTEPDQSNPMHAPRMVFYRPPAASMRSVETASRKLRVRKTVFSFLVTEAGNPQDIVVVSSDMSEMQLAQCRRALGRSIYSPRFENGKPVATEGVQFTSEWYELEPAEAPSAAGT